MNERVWCRQEYEVVPSDNFGTVFHSMSCTSTEYRNRIARYFIHVLCFNISLFNYFYRIFFLLLCPFIALRFSNVMFVGLVVVLRQSRRYLYMCAKTNS